MDYLHHSMNIQQVNQIGMLGLAHVGDAVFEILVRGKLCEEGHSDATEMHRRAIACVNAKAQASAASCIVPFLTEEELRTFKRGKNTKVNSIPTHTTIAEYHLATALEALFGWLYLLGREERIHELFHMIVEGEK